MHRKTVRRGVAALALASGLALAGARPAAAAEPGPLSGSLGWFAGLWSGIVEQSWLGEGIRSFVSFLQSEETDKGFGVDPNGMPIVIDTLPPPDTNG